MHLVKRNFFYRQKKKNTLNFAKNICNINVRFGMAVVCGDIIVLAEYQSSGTFLIEI